MLDILLKIYFVGKNNQINFSWDFEIKSSLKAFEHLKNIGQYLSNWKPKNQFTEQFESSLQNSYSWQFKALQQKLSKS